MKLTKDDYDLTIKEFENERVQLTIRLEAVEAMISAFKTKRAVLQATEVVEDGKKD